MDDPKPSRTEADPRSPKAGRPGRYSRWVIAGMILVWLAAILSRNVIRAHWWAYRLAATESANERLGYFVRLASLGDGAVPAVAGLLKNEDPGIRSFAVSVLHHARSDRAFEELAEASRDQELDVMRLAVQGMAMRGGERSVAVLAAIAGEASDQRRAMVATAGLADIACDSAERVLVKLLRSSPFSGVRVETIEGLERIRSRAAIEPLIDALGDQEVFEGVTESGTRAARAFEADRAVAGPSFKPDLPEPADLELADRHVVWRRAEQALRTITGQSIEVAYENAGDRAVVARAWREWLNRPSERSPPLPP